MGGASAGIDSQTVERKVNGSDRNVRRDELRRVLMRRRWIPSVSLAVILVAAGCSSSGEDDSPTSSSTVGVAATATTIETTATTTSAVVQAELEIVEVEAYDYGFRGLPSEIAAGAPMTLVNTSSTEYHNLVAFQLEADDVRSVEEIIEDFSILPLEALEDEEHQSQPVIGELHAGPGERSKARLRFVSTGRYVLVDLVPQGADPDTAAANENGGQPYKIEGGPPGYHHGMIAVLTVTSE